MVLFSTMRKLSTSEQRGCPAPAHDVGSAQALRARAGMLLGWATQGYARELGLATWACLRATERLAMSGGRDQLGGGVSRHGSLALPGIA